MVYSKSTQNDINELASTLRIESPEFKKFQLGADLVSPSTFNEVDSISGEFCLMVGTIEIRKNHLLLIKVWQRLIEKLGSKCPILVFVGRPGWLAEEALSWLKANNPEITKIHWLPHCYDSQLNWLYQNCLFTLYPSIYEGWGLPVTESLTHGKFCIASQASSIPEAGGNFCEYHDPLSEEECFRLVKTYCDNRELLKKKTDFIKSNFKPTTWADSAESLLLALNSDLK